MRPWLRWALGFALLSSAIALLSGPAERVALVVYGSQVQETEKATASQPRAVAPYVSALRSEAGLPEQLPKVAFDKAEFDPFVGAVAPSKPVRAVPAPPPSPSPPPAVIRQLPPQQYRYIGTLIDPSGKQWVYLARGEVALSVAVGTQLDEGYVVEAIDATGVRLLYAPMDARVVIAIPPAKNAPAQ